jgi:hypothetical protein
MHPTPLKITNEKLHMATIALETELGGDHTFWSGTYRQFGRWPVMWYTGNDGQDFGLRVTQLE